MNIPNHTKLSDDDKRFVENYMSLPEEYRKYMQLFIKVLGSGVLTEEDAHFFTDFLIKHAK